jgi:hypothetical protein
MKNFMRLSAAFAAIALLAAGCANEEQIIEPIDPMQGGDGVLTIGVDPANLSTRALLGADSEAIITAFESNIEEFTVYLFDDAGKFLEQKTSGTDEKQIVFAGYAKGQKLQAVAFANTETAGVTLPVLTVGTHTIADVTTNFKMVVDLKTQVMSEDSFGEILDLLALENLIDFDAATANFDSGLLMSGQYGASTTTGDLDPINGDTDKIYTVGDPAEGGAGYLITIPVERVVARVELGNITFDEDMAFSNILNFRFEGAGVQRAISHSFYYPGEIGAPYAADTNVTPSTDFKYYGTWTGTGASPASVVLPGFSATSTEGSGLLDITELVTDLLTQAFEIQPVKGIVDGIITLSLGTLDVEDIITQLLNGTLKGGDALLTALDALPLLNLGDIIDNPDNFWYVLPNDILVNPTLLTLRGNYDGTSLFYPIVINPTATEGGNTTGTNGNGIQRNNKYVINVEFSKFDNGTTNPDDPTPLTSLKAEVEVVNWQGVNQATIW